MLITTPINYNRNLRSHPQNHKHIHIEVMYVGLENNPMRRLSNFANPNGRGRQWRG